MSREIDLGTWPRAETFRLFRGYARPHFAITARMDATALMSGGERRLPVFRACLWALGAGLHRVEALRRRFSGDRVVVHDRLSLSPAIARDAGGFGYGYLDWHPDYARFEAEARPRIADVRAGAELRPNAGRDDVAYLSCLPWLDYTALDNALPDAQDCIPRVSWGRIVPATGGRHEMAVTLQVHHAVVDGEDAAAFFAEAGRALATLEAPAAET